MKKSEQKKIPQFDSYEKEALWWDENSILDYPDEIASIKTVSSLKEPKSQVLAIRLNQSLLDQITKEAEQKGVGASTLGRIILKEHFTRS